jgi:hypothetical protein
MYTLAAIAFFLALTVVFSAVRERLTLERSKTITARDEDMAGKAPQPGARDRFAVSGSTLGSAPVPSWG